MKCIFRYIGVMLLRRQQFSKILYSYASMDKFFFFQMDSQKCERIYFYIYKYNPVDIFGNYCSLVKFIHPICKPLHIPSDDVHFKSMNCFSFNALDTDTFNIFAFSIDFCKIFYHYKDFHVRFSDIIISSRCTYSCNVFFNVLPLYSKYEMIEISFQMNIYIVPNYDRSFNSWIRT